jgi:hypothetical protein
MHSDSRGGFVREPTGEECSANAYMADIDSYACWYPQQGGYVGKCVIKFRGQGPGACFDAYVWHDGEFPMHDGEEPIRTHHCDADQFIEFGQTVKGFEELRLSGIEPRVRPA